MEFNRLCGFFIVIFYDFVIFFTQLGYKSLCLNFGSIVNSKIQVKKINER